MKVSASWNPVVLMIGREARHITCVLILVLVELVLVLVWSHSILYGKTTLRLSGVLKRGQCSPSPS